MAILVMLGWWYSRGWLWVITITQHRLETISRVFAVSVLLKTWFSPWKQIHEQSNFRNFFQVAVDNAISRIIGSIVRGSILSAALILSILVVIAGVLSLMAWPFIPLLTVILPILTLSGVSL